MDLTNGNSPLGWLRAYAAALCLFAVGTASAQTWWNYDFTAWPVGGGDATVSSIYKGTSPAPMVSAVVTDAGNPQGHVLTLTVDTSAVTDAWSCECLIFPRVTFAGYDPDRTFLSFDALVSEAKPFSAKLSYVAQNGFFIARNLLITVTPTNAGTFQHYSFPLSAFTTSFLMGNPPDYPTSIEFIIAGDPAKPDTSWGFDSGNMLSVDNVAYTVVPPPLNLGTATNGVVVSWPASITPFVLQQSSSGQIASWTDVTNSPVLVDGVNQVVISSATGQGFYRLRSP